MKLSRSIPCLAFLGLSIAATAQTVDYFPLDAGNTWMYRLTGSRSTETAFRTIAVEGRETVNGAEYWRVRYFERVVYLRSNTDGSIVSLNRASGNEEPWLKAGAPVGATFDSHIDQCTNTGRVDARGTEVVTPAGKFTDTVQISFRGNCADAGTTQQIYAAGIGAVIDEETSFAGPRRYELIYFRVGSATGGVAEKSFTIGLDALRYKAGSDMGVRLTLRSTLPEPIALHFSSGQSYDLKIFNGAGEVVYAWSADKLFILIIRDEQFGPGERTYGFPVSLGKLPPGPYVVQAFLTASPGTYQAEISFDIVP
jgi:hypothetical protein